mmetsp:Transcript_30684/g.86767  ORF Transcript_30684/g.86767 Transcript_30684/m.86767 type:complete len:177 (-) Transcript_30684:65-595(-)
MNKKPIKTLALINLPRESMEDFLRQNPSFISGFVDGEGCFTFYFTKRGKLGVQITPSFSISQSMRSKQIVFAFETYFQCGGIRKVQKDGTFKYEVRSIQDLNHKIIPFFQKYPLYTTKWQDFEIFVYVCSLIQKKLHLTQNGMKDIINLVFTMNNNGQHRQYSKEEFLKILDKVKV